MSLKETLESLKKQKDLRKKVELDKPQVITERQGAVSHLFDKVQEYLAEYESIGVGFSRETIQLSEDGLGIYPVDKLIIRTPGKSIVMTPVGRLVLGGTGRVDIHVHGRALSDERHMMLRIAGKVNGDLDWFVSSPPAPVNSKTQVHFGPRQFMPLDKEIIEGTVDWLLK